MDSLKSCNHSSDDDPSDKGKDFASLELNDIILKWLDTKNFKHMTKVQSLAIKTFLKKENDVLVQSHTGSGKTLCFVIPILQTYLSDKNYEFKNLLDVFSLIILPTRELSIQVFDIMVEVLMFIENNGLSQNINTKLKHTFTIMEKNLYCSLIIGGTTVDNDIKFLSNSTERGYVKSFIIATPGRLRHLMDLLEHQFVWTFKNLCFLILDEADRFLEMGYQNDMSQIFKHLPKQRKTGLFSATLTSGVDSLCKLCLSDPIFINADESTKNHYSSLSNEISRTTAYTTPKALNNYYIILTIEEKIHFLLLFIHYLKLKGAKKLVVFFLSCDLVDYFYEVLTRLNSNSDPSDLEKSSQTTPTINFFRIHRKMKTKKRNKSINLFKSDSNDVLNVLLCTDIFSRGIDIPNIDWILQLDPPQDPNFYLHRIGRTGRADNTGNAILFITENEESYIHFQMNRNINLSVFPHDILEDLKNIYNSDNTDLPFVLRATKVENDTTLSENESYFEYLKSNKIDKCILPWERTSVILSYLRLMNSKNRELLLLSSKAFVSYTRAYSEHSLKHIFEKNKLEYGSLATSLGVLRIPRVREILGRKISHFVQSSVNPIDVPFLDPEKEEKRIQELNERVNEKESEVKREKKKVVKKKVKRTRSEKREAKRKNEFEDWNEFRREEAMIKKLKKKGFRGKDIENLGNEEDSDFDNELKRFKEELEGDPSEFKKWILRGKKRKKKR